MAFPCQLKSAIGVLNIKNKYLTIFSPKMIYVTLERAYAFL